MSAPFLHLKRMDGATAARGHPACVLGHKLPGRSGCMPDGVFAEWTWDGTRLVVRNDRYGMYPLFYFTTSDAICLSSSVPELLHQGAPRDLDDPALAVFLRVGCFVGEDTPFRAIRALPPAALLTWEDGRLHVSGGPTLGRLQDRTRTETIDAFIALFRQAIRRRLPPSDNFALPLSGGRDSRYILFELQHAGYRPRFCLTARYFPPRPSQEVKIAARLTEAVGVPHVILPHAQSRLRAELRKNLETSFCADEHAWILPVGNYLRERVDGIYDGLGGGAFCRSPTAMDREVVALWSAGRLTELGERLVQARMSEGQMRGLLTPSAYRRWSRGAALDRILLELQRHADAPNPGGSYIFWNNYRRELALAPFGILGHIGTVFCPYLDHDLYDFMASLPGRNLLDRALQAETIRRAHPQYADIPFEPDDLPPAQDPAHMRLFIRQFASYALGHGRSEVIRPSYLLPRLLRRFLDGDAWRTGSMYFFTVYLLQLERLVVHGPASDGALPSSRDGGCP